MNRTIWSRRCAALSRSDMRRRALRINKRISAAIARDLRGEVGKRVNEALARQHNTKHIRTQAATMLADTVASVLGRQGYATRFA